MRLGLFGGSFDPVHNAHLRLAECCLEQAQLDQVWFVPAALQPLKPHGPVASDADRAEMLRLAIAERPRFVLSLVEIDRGGVSYTVDTLREIRRRWPDAKLFFLMGADTLRDLPNWREPEEVFRLMTPLVVQRPGEQDLSNVPNHLRVEFPPQAISSSEIRHRLSRGEPVEDLLPPRVADYIALHGLYR